MQLTFTAKTNKDYVMINTAEFRLKDGTLLTIDRDETRYSIENGILQMEWTGCYLWEINSINIFNEPAYLNEDSIKLFEAAELFKLNLEDDADSDYEVTDVRVYHREKVF